MRAIRFVTACAVALLTTPALGQPAKQPVARPAGCAVSTVRLRVPPVGVVRDLRFSADGTVVAGTVLAAKQSFADRVVFWNGRTGAEVATLRVPGPHRVHDVVLAPDGRRAYVTSTTAKPAAALRERDPAAYRAALAAYRRVVRAIAVPSLREAWRRDDLEGRLELSRDGATLLTVADGGGVTLLATADGTTVGRLGVNALLDVALVPGSREVVAVSAAGGVERLGFERPKARTTLRPAAHDRTPGKLAVSADGALLATLSYGTVEVLDLRTGARRWSYQRHDGASLAFRGARLFGVHHDAAAVVAVIHGRDGRRLAELRLEGPSPLAVSGAGDALAALDARGALVIRDLNFAKCSGKQR